MNVFIPAVPPGLTLPRPLNPYSHTAPLITEMIAPSPLLKRLRLFGSPSKAHSPLPLRRVSTVRRSLCHRLKGYSSFSLVWLYHSRAIKPCQALYTVFGRKIQLKNILTSPLSPPRPRKGSGRRRAGRRSGRSGLLSGRAYPPPGARGRRSWCPQGPWPRR